MKYEITGYDLEAKKQHSTIISKEIHDKIAESKSVCLQAVAFEERIRLVFDNFYEFESDLLSLAHDHLANGGGDHPTAMKDRLLLDRRIVNLVTACRLYTDQTRHAVSSIFGKTSTEFDQVEKKTNQLYDASFAYRFMEAIRNYLQHNSLTVHSITYQTATTVGSYVEHVVRPMVSFADLAHDKKFKPAVLKEAEDRKLETMDLRGPIREYLDSLHELHLYARSICKHRFDSAAMTYADAKKLLTGTGGQLGAFELMKTDTSQTHLPFELESLPDHILLYYEHLKKQQLPPGKLLTSYVSNGRLQYGEKP